MCKPKKTKELFFLLPEKTFCVTLLAKVHSRHMYATFYPLELHLSCKFFILWVGTLYKDAFSISPSEQTI